MRIRPAPLPRLNDGAVEVSLALTLDDAAGRVLAVSTSPAPARAGTTPDSKTRFAGDAGLSPTNVLSLLSADAGRGACFSCVSRSRRRDGSSYC
jgi:hypothetical protein